MAIKGDRQGKIGNLPSRKGYWLMLALLIVLATSSVLYCLGKAEGLLLKQVTATLPDGQVLMTWPSATESISDSNLQWSDWLVKVRGATRLEAQDPLALENLKLLHYLTFDYPWGIESLSVHYQSTSGFYFIKEGSVVYQVPDTASWFNPYLLAPKMRPVYSSAGPTPVSLRQQGPKGIVTVGLSPALADWFYYDARRMPQRLDVLALSVTPSLPSKVVEQPKVQLGEADALEVLGLDHSVKVDIEVYSDSLRKNRIGKVTVDQISGRITPWKRSGETFYRMTITKLPGAPLIGEGYGRAVYDFVVVMERAPKVSGFLQPQSAGGIFTLVVEDVPPGAVPVIQQQLVSRVKWHTETSPSGLRYIALVPLGYTVKAGEHPFKISLSYKGGNYSSWQFKGNFSVKARSFAIQRLVVDTVVEAQTRTDEAYAEYNKYFVPARDNSNPKALWQGPFIQPIQGRLTTEWGMKRSVNGALTTYRHNGIDLAAPEGTDVQASNSGRVVLARDLMLTGKSIIVDHGLGLFTAYLHLSALQVKPGQSLKKGQIIGKVGSTGFSTGPHLHFSIYYHRTALDPQLLIQWHGALQ